MKIIAVITISRPLIANMSGKFPKYYISGKMALLTVPFKVYHAYLIFSSPISINSVLKLTLTDTSSPGDEIPERDVTYETSLICLLIYH